MDTIFTITKALEDLFLSLPDTGEMTDEQVAEYENLGIAMAEKQENTLKYFRKLELDEEAVDSELERLKALKVSVSNKKNGILRLVEYSMDKQESNELNFGSIKAVRKLNPPKVVIDETVDLAEEWLRTKTIVEPDKTKIKDALKAGNLIEGCRLQQDTRIDIL